MGNKAEIATAPLCELNLFGDTLYLPYKLQIEPLVDLQVGANYQDHFVTRVSILLNDSVSIINSRDLNAPVMFDYLQNKKGQEPLQIRQSCRM
jgi:hypothetical protein